MEKTAQFGALIRTRTATEFFFEKNPAKKSDEDRCCGNDPGSRCGLRGNQSIGLQPLMKGDADESEEGKVPEFPQ
ncbi:MAG: hypothetical protein HW407_1636 [Bacteroidetes bacterium]|nr:hypothetical protein [Bacteroidota bacterium]